MSKNEKSVKKKYSDQPSKTIDIFSLGVLNALSSHICVVDSEGQIIAINQAWTGFGQENGAESQLISEGSNYFEACQKAINNEGLQSAKEAIEGIKSVLNGHTDLFEMEYDCHSPDEKRWFLMRVSPMKFRGNKAVISHINITQKKLAEEELSALHDINQYISEPVALERVTQRILEKISTIVKPDLCFLFLREDDDLKLLGAYPEGGSVFNDEKYAHRVGHCLCGTSVRLAESVFSANIHDDHRCTYQECKEAGLTSFAAIPLIRKNKAIGTIGIASYERRDFSSSRRFLETVAIDIAIVLDNSLLFEQASKSAMDLERQLASRQELEAQLLQIQKMDAIGTLAGGIAHDFNNLLAIIKGNLDLLEAKQFSLETVQEKTANINKAVARATDLVRQILSFSRQKSLKAEPVDLNVVINEDIKFLRSTIPTSVEILKTLNAEPIIINADNTQLQQVLINLCNNAVHSMGNKGLLKIGTEEQTLTKCQLPIKSNIEPGRFARLSISDSGIGIEKENLDKIFDPFFTTKDSGSGTGLGLSVVHGIVRAHGGFITVDSESNQGSTFHLYFPIHSGGTGRKEGLQFESLPTGRGKILFVDDEEFLANLGAEMLEYLGYEVVKTINSKEALQLFSSDPQSYELVITDQTMPELSGIELASELVKIRPDIPVILCSGYSPEVSEGDLKKQGIRRFCMKPLSMQQLGIIVREVLGG